MLYFIKYENSNIVFDDFHNTKMWILGNVNMDLADTNLFLQEIDRLITPREYHNKNISLSVKCFGDYKETFVTAYEKYKLWWMIQNGWTLSGFLKKLYNYIPGIIANAEDISKSSLAEFEFQEAPWQSRQEWLKDDIFKQFNV